MNLFASVCFALALLHTLCAPLLARWLATRGLPPSPSQSPSHPPSRHAGLWHLLCEVEAVFMLWALVFMLGLWASIGQDATLAQLRQRSFTEPLFVLVTMIVSASRPVLHTVTLGVEALVKVLPGDRRMALLWVVLTVVPLLGSVITEPAAMTLAALLLGQQALAERVSARFLYATLAVLFVNVSIGGTLTPYAAPPVLMVAQSWQWDLGFMLQEFGWRSALAVVINASVLTWLHRHEFHPHALHLHEWPPGAPPPAPEPERDRPPLPLWSALIHVGLLAVVIAHSHEGLVFVGVFMVFLGLVKAYPEHHDRLIAPEAMMVAGFLAGLVVLGGSQAWWLQPLVAQLSDTTVFWGALVLTAGVDNAALTYLGSTLTGLSESFKLALVSGAVAGGGLTVIANAPNPTGFALLKSRFPDQSLNPLRLFMAACWPTAVAAALLSWR